jgi:type IV secretory pathway VirB4 component
MLTNLKIGVTPQFSPVKILEADRYKGTFIAGMPGAGKSALISNFWKQDSILKTAKVLIDPSGFLAQEAYAMSKGIYCSIDNPVGINPMMDDYAPDDIADNIIECINQVVELSTDNVKLSARMRSILREAIVWCIDKGRRRMDSVVDYIQNHCQGHQETRQSVMDRLNMFIQDRRMKTILCEAPPINWEDIVENRQTFILDCHGMSEDKMIFLGTLVTHGIKSYLRFSKKENFKPLVLVCDECHLFINPNYFTIIKEGRKYRIATILATQDFANMPAKLARTILSNIGTLISFRVGYAEASALAREFTTLQTADLQTLPKYHCAYRTPNTEGIAKTCAPPFVKKAAVEKLSIKEETFNLEWFDLQPA